MKLDPFTIVLLEHATDRARSRTEHDLERRLNPVHFERLGLDALRAFDVEPRELIPPRQSWVASLLEAMA